MGGARPQDGQNSAPDFFDQHLKKMMCAPSFVDQPRKWAIPKSSATPGAPFVDPGQRRALEDVSLRAQNCRSLTSKGHRDVSPIPGCNMKKIVSSSEASTRDSVGGCSSRDQTPVPTASCSSMHDTSSFPTPASQIVASGSLDALGDSQVFANKPLVSRCSSKSRATMSPRRRTVLPLESITVCPPLGYREKASSSVCAPKRDVQHADVTEWVGQIYGGNACTAKDDQPRRLECVRCGKKQASYFDHCCPKCKATVCISCLDDFRLIINSYRCPQCGDQEENQAVLSSELWMIDAYRGAQHAWTALRLNVASLLSSVDPCTVQPLHRQPIHCHQHEFLLQAEQAYTARRAAELATAAVPAAPSYIGRPPSPPRPSAGDAAVPEYQTRPPVTWSDTPGAANAAARWGGALQASNDSSTLVAPHGHRSVTPVGGRTGPIEYVRGATRNGRSGEGAAHQTRLPAAWGHR